ncbi:MAG TPA: cobalamin-independent methionine synthase II family protein [Xanthobacteraceae bacterium]|jgi:5-methyltetrahydropteroyltriglutamate--homocysteine methyltransferase|nr:cobalamin-independent methionine synthase II family protein [Xanthobacteraceae bacterium]
MSVIEESRHRILTTGVGSLPRRHALSDLLLERMIGKPFDAKALERETTEAVAEVVNKQIELGVDIISDGEQSKTSFQHYIADRLTGLEPITPKAEEKRTRENAAFPTYYKDGAHSGSQQARLACTGPIKYAGQKQLAEDIANFKAALKGKSPVGAFIPSVSPSSCAGTMENKYYKSEEEHLLAVAEALREEYEGIVAAGLEVQIDDPRLAMHYMLSPQETPEDARKWARRRIEILNHALRNIPPEKIRHHTCYGINIGPRVSDFEMKYLADLIVTIRAKYYSFEMANARHEHEWEIWQTVKLPDDKVLLPGCITQASVLVEHPELVAQRVVRLARIVGRERVIASADCGFASTLYTNKPPEIEPEIVWAKFESLVEGARLATKALWAKAAA